MSDRPPGVYLDQIVAERDAYKAALQRILEEFNGEDDPVVRIARAALAGLSSKESGQ